MDETVEVTVLANCGPAGDRYRVFEVEYPEEGYVGDFDHHPTEVELKELCESYVEKKPCR